MKSDGSLRVSVGMMDEPSREGKGRICGSLSGCLKLVR